MRIVGNRMMRKSGLHGTAERTFGMPRKEKSLRTPMLTQEDNIKADFTNPACVNLD
jgi:hypothetical protein